VAVSSYLVLTSDVMMMKFAADVKELNSKFPAEFMFCIVHILKISGVALFCNLLVEQPCI